LACLHSIIVVSKGDQAAKMLTPWRPDFYMISRIMRQGLDDIKKPRGRPRANTTPVLSRLPPDLLTHLDKWIKRHAEPHPSRPEAIRLILKDWLSSPRARAALKTPTKKAKTSGNSALPAFLRAPAKSKAKAEKK
jgi:hypothetical protein